MVLLLGWLHVRFMDYLDRTTKFSKRLFSTKGVFFWCALFWDDVEGGISDESYNEMISDLNLMNLKLMKIKDISKVH
jgi:hypothetical protein